jgi:hypothetical protein
LREGVGGFWKRRIKEGLLGGTAVGIAATLAQLIQGAIQWKIFGPMGPAALDIRVIAVGLVGFACGFSLGLFVPAGHRGSIVGPQDATLAKHLSSLLRQASVCFGGKNEAEAWVFESQADLGGITPAEAVQYTARANEVKRLLESKSRPERERPPALVVHSGLRT